MFWYCEVPVPPCIFFLSEQTSLLEHHNEEEEVGWGLPARELLKGVRGMGDLS